MSTELIPNWLPLIYLIVHTTLSLKAPHTTRHKAQIVALNLVLGVYFASLIAWGLSLSEPTGWSKFLLLWSPIIFFWWAYLWSKHTLTGIHSAGVHFDSVLIQFELRYGQPSLSWARKGNRLLSEILHIFYFSYYLYTPVIAIYLDASNRLLDFGLISFAVTFGYLVSYVTFALVPVYGPRWSLVEAGLLPISEQRAQGYWITEFTNKLMFGGLALKGGAMPSSHSSTAVVFWYWCWVIWGIPGGIVGAIIAGGMGLGAVYGRYHFVTDIVVGALLGVVGIILAEIVMAS